ncbi:MAG: flagellar biosynthesis anti-sigma factor FlgM [Hafnia sp.]|uniref:flagellar biosynthesis anti-sigma factor FlgM n=1 Tax=Obesumbacterium proteus TaxID=82983 RepID=UPI00069959BC|nr:flagellar biosynthesis anti-sigma factor FlgM [Obesumbacterium proteus]MDN6019538.1 flagellar biosynthesis anti-sigma factor FlgM [Enterobacterales bacterium]AMO83570.1 hypothetical protein DSM2777_22535 [Obesumbacterium proteus]MCE9883563.1 flagellar biosynthesis anti-sigma factor FlgM [Obesumbacterium proteus]MCE9915164.1 flagellar biosynthesis anti-sigma factor FlgM [Obesumbacterium proteus]MCE9927934.1 flagellar biosynthesis anti-sigma factor FlgM [Obesumbacterium proteus]
MSINRAQPISPSNAQHDLAVRPRTQSVSTSSAPSDEVIGIQVSILKQTTAIQNDTTKDINVERLANIKAAMDAGELHIDTDKIAHALLQDMLNF